ncbi:MAG: hypothetical protein RIE22_03390 [Alphaproteobacteria bacterium]
MSALPPAYDDLEPFVPVWAHPTENERSRRRWAAAPEDFQQFYDAMLPRIEAILTDLDRHDLNDLPESARPLYYLALAFAEVAPHIELYGGSAEVPNSFLASRVIAGHGDRED